MSLCLRSRIVIAGPVSRLPEPVGPVVGVDHGELADIDEPFQQSSEDHEHASNWPSWPPTNPATLQEASLSRRASPF